ncbi:hypothetical protein N7463_008764 [Penicillium fimorum]|uniref:DDE-1 domain-containing protein n=1 Tax=Penicillium fimorum TaxID=1882269 RepID=A0A9X0C3K6_9EURO|nr:hypothetical protein N7463_008764 [Penicillium fimorum]
MRPLVTTSAKQILNHDGNDASISKAWVERFIKGLPDDLKPPKTRSTKKKRLDASDQETLELWYERLRAVIANVSPENIYNFGDTIFQIGEGMKPRTYCEWITTIEFIAADGWVAGPLTVVQGHSYFEHWFSSEGTRGRALFMMSPSGRVGEQACMQMDRTKDRAPDGQPRLLLFRGQPQYLSFKFLDFCEQHKIIPFSFPPNIGHLMQPFDGNPFQDYKQYWKSQGFSPVIDDVDEEKTYFFQGLSTVRETSFKPDVITIAFADRGIVPFDPSKVGQPL